MLGAFSVHPKSGQQTLASHGHEHLGCGDSHGDIHRVHPLPYWSLILEVRPWLFVGAFILVFLPLLSSSFPLGCQGILHVDIFDCSRQESFELGSWLLSQGFEEVSVQQSLRKGIGLNLLGHRRNFQGGRVEMLEVLLQGFSFLLADGEEA
ncbi:UNVERIFIED_CONTAM: hypothetical protein Sradi_0898200 [Sesamum radiatum]|uniref:Uncharacterized protein n=1 Tax=Sesamum radiatum TaxID=300843 RepID=A0AAW2V2E4_SESRA